jgi:4-amino-4-deoxy-L-arabinose transferase-like glycosyltransferase
VFRARALILFAIGAIAMLVVLRFMGATDPLDRLSHGQGELLIARGGPVIVGFQSPSKATLTVAGHVITGTGLVKDRVVLPAGPAHIQFDGPAESRLVWSPVGRRGDPEYVMPGAVASSPDGLRGDDSRRDGVYSAACLIVVIAVLCLLAQRRLGALPRRWWLAMAAIFVAACVIRWIDLSGHGQTWDEDVNWSAGRNYVTNLLSLDFRSQSWIWNYEHPPIMKYLEGIGAQFADGYGPARALSAIWIAIGCALLVPIGARLFSFRVGLLAAIIAALLPPLVAHGQIVGHEAPTVMWWNLAILAALGVSDVDDVRTTRTRTAWTGVAIGIAVASRFVNGFVGVLALAIIAIRTPASRRRRVVLEAAVAMPLIAFATLYAVWPRMWLHPIGALAAAFDKLKQTHGAEPFLGAMTAHPGPHYFAAYLFATLPLGALIGVALFAVRAWRRRSGERESIGIVLLWLVVPMLAIISPVRQDGVRYVMPSVVALAVLSAAGWEALTGYMRWRYAFAALSAALAIYLAMTLVRVHPYYLDYFAEQVGGAGTVAKHKWFETAWWGEGVDRSVDYVNANAAPSAHVYRDCIEPAHLAWFREDLWEPMVRTPNAADWIVTYSPDTHPCAIPAGFTRVFTVDVDGATLSEVWKR